MDSPSRTFPHLGHVSLSFLALPLSDDLLAVSWCGHEHSRAQNFESTFLFADLGLASADDLPGGGRASGV